MDSAFGEDEEDGGGVKVKNDEDGRMILVCGFADYFLSVERKKSFILMFWESFE